MTNTEARLTISQIARLSKICTGTTAGLVRACEIWANAERSAEHFRDCRDTKARYDTVSSWCEDANFPVYEEKKDALFEILKEYDSLPADILVNRLLNAGVFSPFLDATVLAAIYCIKTHNMNNPQLPKIY